MSGGGAQRQGDTESEAGSRLQAVSTEPDRDNARDRVQAAGGADRGRHRIRSGLQALSCQHRARRGAQTHKPRDHDLSRSRTLNRLSHPSTPCHVYLTLRVYLLILESASILRTGPDSKYFRLCRPDSVCCLFPP